MLSVRFVSCVEKIGFKSTLKVSNEHTHEQLWVEIAHKQEEGQIQHFSLRPSAKDQGITGVVVLVLVLVLVHHLVHFLFRINLSEKNFSLPGN